jgi:hypothetical protein
MAGASILAAVLEQVLDRDSDDEGVCLPQNVPFNMPGGKGRSGRRTRGLLSPVELSLPCFLAQRRERSSHDDDSSVSTARVYNTPTWIGLLRTIIKGARTQSF